MFDYTIKKILTCFLLIVVGYFIAKMFSQKCNGFSVGAPINCEGITNQANCHNHLRHGCEFKDGKCVRWCNNNQDCNGHHNKCKGGLCQCKNDKFNFNANPPCSECNNTYFDSDQNCRWCKDRDGIDGDWLDPDKNCEKCYNGLDISSSCTKCIDDDLDPLSLCTVCKDRDGIDGELLDPDNCDQCVNDDLDISSSCTLCKKKNGIDG